MDKVRENKARRAAERQGLRLEKSRRRDTRALSFDRWQLVTQRGRVVFGTGPLGEPGATLEEIEEYLNAGGAS